MSKWSTLFSTPSKNALTLHESGISSTLHTNPKLLTNSLTQQIQMKYLLCQVPSKYLWIYQGPEQAESCPTRVHS